MRRAVLAFILSAPLLSGCAGASPVTINWDYPRFNAVQGSCAVSPDTLRDLGRVQIWAQQQGRTDSVLVLDRTATGKEGQPDSLVTNQQEGTTFYWAFLFDLVGNRACRSNTTSKTVVLTPAPAVMR